MGRVSGGPPCGSHGPHPLPQRPPRSAASQGVLPQPGVGARVEPGRTDRGLLAFAPLEVELTAVAQVLIASVVSHSVCPPGLSPTRLLCPWDSPGRNTGVGCHALPPGIFLTQGSNLHLLCLLPWQVRPLPLVPPGKPCGPRPPLNHFARLTQKPTSFPQSNTALAQSVESWF